MTDSSGRSRPGPEVAPERPRSHGDGLRRVLPAGERAVLVELPDLAAALGLHARIEDLQRGPAAIPGVEQLLPAARTLLVGFDPRRIRRGELLERLDALSAAPVDRSRGTVVEVPAVYDGEDLAEMAELLGMSADALAQRHGGTEWTAGFAGFAPGFVYLVDGDPVFDVPRRATPRTRIPAGSIALAGRWSGVYPRESPGGWQLIGRTPLQMWDVDRDPPAAIRPGDRVRFVPSRGESVRAAAPRTAAVASEGPGLIVERPGLRTLVQDAGRPGLEALGVAASGALDVPAMRLANRLVGNPPDAAVLEIPFGGLRVRARGPVVVAVTGARLPVTAHRGEVRREVIDQRAVALDDGDVLELGEPAVGRIAVLALRGGIGVPPVLGSRATDTLAGLGPDPVAEGDLLPVGAEPVGSTAAPEPWPADPLGELHVPVVLGPRDDWFAPASVERLLHQPWTITPLADRVGLRLEGDEPLARAVDGELPSEGAPIGAVQVPPSGQPMVFLADHPSTGGYPIIAVVRHDALAPLAQARSGTRIRFTLDTPVPH